MSIITTNSIENGGGLTATGMFNSTLIYALYSFKEADITICEPNTGDAVVIRFPVNLFAPLWKQIVIDPSKNDLKDAQGYTYLKVAVSKQEDGLYLALGNAILSKTPFVA